MSFGNVLIKLDSYESIWMSRPFGWIVLLWFIYTQMKWNILLFYFREWFSFGLSIAKSTLTTNYGALMSKPARCIRIRIHAYIICRFVFTKRLKLWFFLFKFIVLCAFSQWLKGNEPNACAYYTYIGFAQPSNDTSMSTSSSWTQNTRFSACSALLWVSLKMPCLEILLYSGESFSLSLLFCFLKTFMI